VGWRLAYLVLLVLAGTGIALCLAVTAVEYFMGG